MSFQPIRSFDFNRDINVDAFKQSLRYMGNTSKEIDGFDLKITLEESIIKLILQGASHGDQIGISQLFSYGFKSTEAIESFLTQPKVSEILREKLRDQPPLSNDLMTRMHLTLTNATAEIEHTDIADRVSGSAVLATLPYIFDLIKNLSDEEVDDIQLRYSGSLYAYTNGATLKEFRDDMIHLAFDKFEEKYAGCYNGMLDNVVAKIIDHEKLLQVIKEETPILERDVAMRETGGYSSPPHEERISTVVNSELKDMSASSSPTDDSSEFKKLKLALGKASTADEIVKLVLKIKYLTPSLLEYPALCLDALQTTKHESTGEGILKVLIDSDPKMFASMCDNHLLPVKRQMYDAAFEQLKQSGPTRGARAFGQLMYALAKYDSKLATNPTDSRQILSDVHVKLKAFGMGITDEGFSEGIADQEPAGHYAPPSRDSITTVFKKEIGKIAPPIDDTEDNSKENNFGA